MRLFGFYNLANGITLLGLTLAVVAAFLSFHNQLELALICFMYAGLCDLFDGWVARKLKLGDDAREFGKQLDSLVDMASFGIVPVLIALHSGANSLTACFVMVIYTGSVAIRLAYFNVSPAAELGLIKFYTGLPVTYAALILLIAYTFLRVFNLSGKGLIPIVLLGLSCLYLLRVPIPKPRGLAYVFFPLLAVFLTWFWGQQYLEKVRPDETAILDTPLAEARGFSGYAHPSGSR